MCKVSAVFMLVTSVSNWLWLIVYCFGWDINSCSLHSSPLRFPLSSGPLNIHFTATGGIAVYIKNLGCIPALHISTICCTKPRMSSPTISLVWRSTVSLLVCVCVCIHVFVCVCMCGGGEGGNFALFVCVFMWMLMCTLWMIPLVLHSVLLPVSLYSAVTKAYHFKCNQYFTCSYQCCISKELFSWTYYDFGHIFSKTAETVWRESK